MSLKVLMDMHQKAGIIYRLYSPCLKGDAQNLCSLIKSKVVTFSELVDKM